MSDLNGTYGRVTEITPSDDTNISETDGLAVNASGNVRFLDAHGNDRTLYRLAGVDYAMRVRRVFATDTTATGIHGLYFSHQ